MPAFTFEKISPPVRRAPDPVAVNDKPRGVMVQMLERFVELRVRRKLDTGKWDTGKSSVVGERCEPSRDGA